MIMMIIFAIYIWPLKTSGINKFGLWNGFTKNAAFAPKTNDKLSLE